MCLSSNKSHKTNHAQVLNSCVKYRKQKSQIKLCFCIQVSTYYDTVTHGLIKEFYARSKFQENLSKLPTSMY